MSQLPAMPVWVADFYSKTYHLTREQKWAYLDLMMKTWVRNCNPFPDDPKELSLLLGMTVNRWLMMRPKLAPFFDLSGGTWRQENLEKQFVFVAERKQKMRSNGCLGGRPKSNNTMDLAKPTGSDLVKPIESTHTHTQVKKEEKKDSRSSAPADGEFEVWWKEVPRKVGKGGARKAHRTARKKAPADVLLAGIVAYALSRAGQDEQYTVHPATWLNDERWLDSYETEDSARSVPSGPYVWPEDRDPDVTAKPNGAVH